MVDTWSVEEFPTRYLAERAEMRAAHREGPLYSVVHGEWFKSSAREAREAILAHLELLPAPWRKPNPDGRAPMPYRVNRWAWQGAVSDLSADSAAALSRALTVRRPDLAEELAEEFEAAPPPWGHHAAVARALLIGAATLQALQGQEPTSRR